MYVFCVCVLFVVVVIVPLYTMPDAVHGTVYGYLTVACFGGVVGLCCVGSSCVVGGSGGGGGSCALGFQDLFVVCGDDRMYVAGAAVRQFDGVFVEYFVIFVVFWEMSVECIEEYFANVGCDCVVVRGIVP